MFFSRWEQGGPWNYDGIKGPQRLLFDVWEAAHADYTAVSPTDSATRALRRKTHQTIRKVTGDLTGFSFNTAVAAIMELRNDIKAAQDKRQASAPAMTEAIDTLLLLQAPIAPYITEELWSRRGHGYSIHQQSWPSWEEEVAREEAITLIVQINGKVRDRIEVPADIAEEAAKEAALASALVQNHLNGQPPRQVIYVPGRLVNIVG